MTYQVSDTNLSANEIRRIVVAQTLVAYLFGAVILASVVNGGGWADVCLRQGAGRGSTATVVSARADRVTP
jgi:hypothetical protein